MNTIIEMAREAGLVFNEEHGTDIAKSIHLGRVQAFSKLVAAAEREAIYAEWHSCVMSDLENGVKWLNEKAAADWHKNYPAQSKLFPAWIEARGNT